MYDKNDEKFRSATILTQQIKYNTAVAPKQKWLSTVVPNILPPCPCARNICSNVSNAMLIWTSDFNTIIGHIVTDYVFYATHSLRVKAECSGRCPPTRMRFAADNWHNQRAYSSTSASKGHPSKSANNDLFYLNKIVEN